MAHTTTPRGRGLGWKPSLPDIRDYRHSFRNIEVAPEVDLRKSGFLPDIWDQGQLGSCTAHGSSAAYSYDLAKQGLDKNFEPSRLYVYYNTRVIENTVSEDSGATITDAIKSINRYGCPIESDWQYNISQFAVKPPQKAYSDGTLREAVKYARVNQTLNDMQACLTSELPIVIGFTVYESFESDTANNTGDIPMPSSKEQVLGGHCVLVVGYTERNGQPVWIARNSWGTDWGDSGYFYFPQAYLLDSNLADDFWTVQSVSSPDPSPVPPSPTPTPVPLDADQTLWAEVGEWANARHIKQAKVTAEALKTWAKAKGLA